MKQANYKGDPIPYRLLNNYYTNQVATAQVLVEMWQSVGLNVQIETKENWSQIMERAPSRARARLVELAPPSTIRCRRSSPSTARNGQQQQIGEWTNAELNKLSRAPGDLDRPGRAARRRSAACWRSASARTPPIRCCTRTRPSPRSRNRSNGRRAPAFRDGFPRRQLAPWPKACR